MSAVESNTVAPVKADFDGVGFDGNDVMKEIAAITVKQIPVIGGVLSPIVKQLFASHDSVWSQIEKQVEALVNKRILKEKVTYMHSTFTGLETTFEKAAKYEGLTQHEKFSHLDDLMDVFRNQFKELPRGGREWLELLPFVTLMALLHTLITGSLVRTSLEHDTKHNHEQFKKDLEQVRKDYSEYIFAAASETYFWRLDQIEVSSYSGITPTYSTITMKDKFTGKKLSGTKGMFDFSGKSEIDKKIREYKEKIRKETQAFLENNCTGPLEPWGVSSQFKRYSAQQLADIVGQAIASVIFRRR